MDQKNVLEICVDSLASAVTAERGGADRLELCSDLMEGGITPSAGLVAKVRERVGIGVFVMIRPRGGDFVYSAEELDVMMTDIREAKRSGADGIVLGALTQDGRVDVDATRRMVECAAPLPVTFHRALDVTRDLSAACEAVIGAGAHRILTSGGKMTALEGVRQIAELVRVAEGRVAVMAGSGVRAENAVELARQTGVREFHGSLRRAVDGPFRWRESEVRFSPNEDDFVRYVLAEDDVRSLRVALD